MNGYRYKPFVPSYARRDERIGIIVAPSGFYAKLREMRNVRDNYRSKIAASETPSLIQAFQTWSGDFDRFYNKYLDERGEPLASSKGFGFIPVLAIAESEDEQADRLRSQLESMVQRYEALVTERERLREEQARQGIPQSKPLEPGDVQLAKDLIPIDQIEKKKPFTIPWWVWALGGATVLGLGYYAYRQYALARGILSPLRLLRGGTSRDPEAYGISGLPESRNGAESMFEYRPYMHPHIVVRQLPSSSGEHVPSTMRSYTFEE